MCGRDKHLSLFSAATPTVGNENYNQDDLSSDACLYCLSVIFSKSCDRMCVVVYQMASGWTCGLVWWVLVWTRLCSNGSITHISPSHTGTETSRSSRPWIPAVFSTLKRCVCVWEQAFSCKWPKVSSLFCVLPSLCFCLLVISCVYLKKIWKTKPVSFPHSLVVGGWGTAPTDYLSCVRREEKSKIQKYRPVVALMK